MSQTARCDAKRRRKVKRTISNRTIIATTSLFSQRYGLLPCFCDYDPLRMMKRCQVSTLSQSSNAFWHRNEKLTNKKQQRNNSTASGTRAISSTRSNHLKTLRKSIAQRFKRNKKRITARSVIRKRTNTNVIKHRDQPSNTMQVNLDQPLSTQDDSQQSSYDSGRLVSQDESNTLESTISLSKLEQQNINATNRTIQGTSQSTMNDQNSSRKTKRTTSKTISAFEMHLSIVANLRKTRSKAVRKTSNRRTIVSSKRKKQKRTSKQKTTSSKRNLLSTSKRKNSKPSLSRTGSRKTYRRSPFPNPNMFHSIPPLQDSDKITEENVHANHLCCKPITSVKGLSTSDQKKLIEHDYLTLISLLPIYLGSQGDFQHKIREKINISNDGALELDRLMNEWSSARLFIGANSYYKTLTQKI